MFSSSVRCGDERRHRAVARVDVAHPIGVGAEARIVDHVRPPIARNSRSAIAWIDAEIAMYRPSLVRIDIARRGGQRAAAGALRLLARHAIDRRIRPEDRNDRIQQRQIDDLARCRRARPRAARPSPHRRRTAPRPCRPAPAAAAPAGGRRSRSSTAKPDIASTSVPKPGRSRYGPSWPKPVMRTMISFGLRACSTSGPSPISSSVPGPIVLDQHLAAARAGPAAHRVRPAGAG